MPDGDRGRRPILTAKEEAWLEARAGGMSPLEAAKAAGYANPYSAAFKLSRNQTLVALNQITFAAHGIDLPFIVDKLKKLMDAKRFVKATFKGDITDERWVDDADVQLRALELVIELTGMKPTDESRIRQQDDGEEVFMVPDNFQEMTEAQLLKRQQQFRQSQISGVKMILPPQGDV